MSRFLLLNFEDFGLNQDITQTIQSHTLFCICCFKTNVPLINLSSCSHAGYLDRFTKPKLKPFNRVACNDCHLVLKKIDAFNSKVEENFKLLASEYFDITKINTNNTSNLQTKKTVNVSLTPAYSQETDPSTTNSTQEESRRLKNIRTALNILDDVQSSNMGINHNSISGQQILSTVMNVLGTVTNVSKRSSDEMSKTEQVRVKTEMIEIEVPPADESVQVTWSNQWSSKIKTIKLTKEELMRERSLEAQSQAYLKHPYKCESCIIGFFYKENLQDHVARKHSTDATSTIITCEVCLQVLSPANANAHALRHYTRYDCRECNKRFAYFNIAWSHMREHKANGEQTKYRCRFCNFTTDFFPKLKMHRQRHGKFPCKDCGVIFMRAASREKHMSIVHKKTSLHCEKCNISFEHYMSYKKHMHMHAYCATCDLHFLTWHAYRIHVRLSSVHGAMSKPFKCGECGMKFRTVTLRRMHTVSRHPKTHMISCRHCRKTFASERECKSHMVTHSGYDVIYCDHCQRAYKSRIHLIRHLETHSKKVKAKGK